MTRDPHNIHTHENIKFWCVYSWHSFFTFITLPLGDRCHYHLLLNVFVASLKTILEKPNGKNYSKVKKVQLRKLPLEWAVIDPSDDTFQCYGNVFWIPKSEVILWRGRLHCRMIWHILLQSLSSSRALECMRRTSDEYASFYRFWYILPLFEQHMPHYLSHTHSLLASWSAMISAWFEEVATIGGTSVCFWEGQDIAVPPIVKMYLVCDWALYGSERYHAFAKPTIWPFESLG